ncbi:hypothetical protein SZ54_2334 [Rhizobium sp. UR51a]|nr:hypothetical protein SZ54_2334 [Rhizobium sp. UR51a]
MLDSIGVNGLFGLKTTADLFAQGAEHVHFMSALRYPVFVNGKNYNGTPDMLKTPILRQMIDMHLAEEVALLPKALWLPLGPKAELALQHLASRGLVESHAFSLDFHIRAGRMASGSPWSSAKRMPIGRRDKQDRHRCLLPIRPSAIRLPL